LNVERLTQDITFVRNTIYNSSIT